MQLFRWAQPFPRTGGTQSAPYDSTIERASPGRLFPTRVVIPQFRARQPVSTGLAWRDRHFPPGRRRYASETDGLSRSDPNPPITEDVVGRLAVLDSAPEINEGRASPTPTLPTSKVDRAEGDDDMAGGPYHIRPVLWTD
jgi:hypothetical protein